MLIPVMQESFALKMVAVWISIGAGGLIVLPVLLVATRAAWRKRTLEALKGLASLAAIASVFLLVVLAIGWFAVRGSCGDFDEVERAGSMVTFRHSFTGASVTRPLSDILAIEIKEGSDDGIYRYGAVLLLGGDELVTDWTEVGRRRLERDITALRTGLWPQGPPSGPAGP